MRREQAAVPVRQTERWKVGFKKAGLKQRFGKSNVQVILRWHV